MEIKWDEAPEGYPLWIDEAGLTSEGGGWFRDDGDRYTHPNGSHWTKEDEEQGPITVHRRPEPEDWPRVGDRVRVMEDTKYSIALGMEDFVGEESEVMALFDGINNYKIAALMMDDGMCGCFVVEMLEPSPTPEQKAAQEREREIDELYALIKRHANSPVRQISVALYDAGLRFTGDES